MDNIKNKDILQKYGEDLISHCKKEFGFKRPPKLFYVTDQDNYHKLLGRTGYYVPEKEEIHIYITGRHPKDVLRSLAHELVHHAQNLNGELTSGYLGPGYAQKDPLMRSKEEDAYKRGNLAFRDWEDMKKIKFKGEKIMIENKLKEAIKLLVQEKVCKVKKKLKMEGSGMAPGNIEGALRLDEEGVLDPEEMSPEELFRACPAADGDEAAAIDMLQADRLNNTNICDPSEASGPYMPDAEDMARDSEPYMPDFEDMARDRDESDRVSPRLEETKIVTPEQEASFHSRLFGSRLVALNAKLMSNFIKK